MHKKLYDAIFALNIVFQTAFTGVVPAGLIIFGAYLLKNKYELGDGFFAVCIIAAVLLGVYCMFRYAIKASELLNGTKNNDNK